MINESVSKLNEVLDEIKNKKETKRTLKVVENEIKDAMAVYNYHASKLFVKYIIDKNDFHDNILYGLQEHERSIEDLIKEAFILDKNGI